MTIGSIVEFLSDQTVNPDIDPVKMAKSMPDSSAKKLNSVLKAVAQAPPHKFRGGGYWEAMHGQMRGIYEVRIQGKDGNLFRFFCVVTKDASSMEKITVFAALKKRKNEKFKDTDYKKVIRAAKLAGLN